MSEETAEFFTTELAEQTEPELFGSVSSAASVVNSQLPLEYSATSMTHACDHRD